jgi:hypothetical protein
VPHVHTIHGTRDSEKRSGLPLIRSREVAAPLPPPSIFFLPWSLVGGANSWAGCINSDKKKVGDWHDTIVLPKGNKKQTG